MDVVRQSLGASCLDRIDPIAQHRAQDVDHLPVTARLAFQLAPYAADRERQFPLLEGCPVAQGAGFAGQNRYVVQGIEDRFVTPEGTLVLTNNLAILLAFQPVGIRPDLHRPPHGAGIDRVSVLIEPHEAGL